MHPRMSPELSLDGFAPSPGEALRVLRSGWSCMGFVLVCWPSPDLVTPSVSFVVSPHSLLSPSLLPFHRNLYLPSCNWLFPVIISFSVPSPLNISDSLDRATLSLSPVLLLLHFVRDRTSIRPSPQQLLAPTSQPASTKNNLLLLILFFPSHTLSSLFFSETSFGPEHPTDW